MLGLVPGRVAAVQAGGNLGLFPKRLAQEFKAVYTFEPDPEIFSSLCHNAPETNIFKLQTALGSDQGLVSTHRYRRDGKASTHEGVTHVKEGGIIPVLTVDSLRLPVCNLLYLDIEGWEIHAIRGAKETIERCRPVVVAEHNTHSLSLGFSRQDMDAMMRVHGYDVHKVLNADVVYMPRY